MPQRFDPPFPSSDPYQRRAMCHLSKEVLFGRRSAATVALPPPIGGKTSRATSRAAFDRPILVGKQRGRSHPGEPRCFGRQLARSLLTLALLTLIALGPSHTDARGQPKACGSDVRRIEVNKTTLHYFECGQGEPLVFVHGAFGDLQTFREQVEAFATRFRVIVYSRRFFPPNASTSRDRHQSPRHSRGRLANAHHRPQGGSGASRGELVWRVHRARAGSGPS